MQLQMYIMWGRLSVQQELTESAESVDLWVGSFTTNLQCMLHLLNSCKSS